MEANTKKYRACVTVDASVSVEFEAPAGLTDKELKDLAMEKAETPSVCYHCSYEIEVGDLMECVEVVEVENAG